MDGCVIFHKVVKESCEGLPPPPIPHKQTQTHTQMEQGEKKSQVN